MSPAFPGAPPIDMDPRDWAVTRQPLSLAQLADLTEAFDTSDLPIRVDLVDWATTTEAFRRIIAHEKVMVQTPTVTSRGFLDTPLAPLTGLP